MLLLSGFAHLLVAGNRTGGACVAFTVPPPSQGPAAHPLHVHALERRKILVVEDEPAIALNLAAAVQQAGGIAIGPAASVAAAFSLMADHTLDGALLDILLREETSFALADVLAAFNIPFVFVSGLSSALMPYVHWERPLFEKPYDVRDVIASLVRLLAQPASSQSTTPSSVPRNFGASPRVSRRRVFDHE
jgi:DNA-binding NtrC family response regulator